MSLLSQKFKFLRKKNVSPSGHQITEDGGREWENFYRDRWSYDKVVRTTHGVNCTGSCSWNIYVKNGVVAWENQAIDYPETPDDMPDYEPRGCPRGATFSWYLYSPLRVKYPYVRGELAELWREAKKHAKNPIEAWKSIVEDPEKRRNTNLPVVWVALCAPHGMKRQKLLPHPYYILQKHTALTATQASL